MHYMNMLKYQKGEKYGKLTILKEAPRGNLMKNGKRARNVLCECVCGNSKIVATSHLSNGHTVSCGCTRKEKTSKLKLSHGMRWTRIYRIWCNMMSRTSNKNVPNFKDYGGRGITVCKPWQKFEKFLSDMGTSYFAHVEKFGEKDTELDRVDFNGGYSKKNCRWATHREQLLNRRPNKNKKS